MTQKACLMMLLGLFAPPGVAGAETRTPRRFVNFYSRWKSAAASPLVNLSRTFGGAEGRRIAWLKTTIQSASSQTRRLALGFSDEVWVLINGIALLSSPGRTTC